MMDFLKPGTVVETDRIEKMIETIASEIASEFAGRAADLKVVGLQRRGVPFAERLADLLDKKLNTRVGRGKLDITMYRDDIGLRKTLPVIHETDIPFDLNGTVLILADDVIEAGRSVRAALDAITDFGRPAVTRLAVLVDKGKHEFPIAADYVGTKCDAPATRHIKVSWPELDGKNTIEFVDKKQLIEG